MGEQAGAGGGSMDAYKFGTLWQEATRAVSATWASITDIVGLSVTRKIETEKIHEAGKTARHEALLNSANGGSMPMILFAVAAVAIVYFAMQKKK